VGKGRGEDWGTRGRKGGRDDVAKKNHIKGGGRRVRDLTWIERDYIKIGTVRALSRERSNVYTGGGRGRIPKKGDITDIKKGALKIRPKEK